MAGSLWISDKATFGDDHYIYKYDQSGNDTFGGFQTGYGYIYGVGVERSSGCIWVVGTLAGTMVEYDQDGTAQTSFNVPSTKGAGLDADGSIWIAEINAQSITKWDQSGSEITGFSVTISPGGLDVGPDGCIWVSDVSDASIYQYNTGGNATPHDLPAGQCQGVGVEANDSIWTAHYYTVNSIYELDSDTNALNSFAAPGTFTRGIGVEYEAAGSQYSQALTEVVQGRKN